MRRYRKSSGPWHRMVSAFKQAEKVNLILTFVSVPLFSCPRASEVAAIARVTTLFFTSKIGYGDHLE